MICFKDQSFCLAYDQGLCVNHKCYRALNEKQQEQAIKWWGGPDFPVALMQVDVNTCPDYIQPERS